MAAARRPRLGLALALSMLCHGGVLAAVAATTLPARPPAPAAHAVTLAFVHPPLPAAEPTVQPARAAVATPPPPQAKPETVAQAKPVAIAQAKPVATTAQAKPAALAAPGARPHPPPAASVPVAEPAAEAQTAFAAALAEPDASPAPLPVVLRPDYLSPPTPPVYPAAARRLHIEGTVVIRALVERPGLPTEVTLWRSSGESLLDRSALEAVRGWRFRPMTRGGDSVAAWVEVPVTFSITNT